MKKVSYDDDGNITGLYDTSVNNSIPAQSITITLTQYNNILSNPVGYVINTSTHLLESAPAPSDATLLANAKNAKQSEISGYYTYNLYNGFTSSALGSSHGYNNDIATHILLLSLISAGSTANFYYVSGGVLTSASHTLSELQQVLTDLLTARQSTIQNYITKLAAISSASTVSDVNAITW